MYHFTNSPMILSGGYLLLLVSLEVFRHSYLYMKLYSVFPIV